MGLEPAMYQVRKKALELLRFKGKRARERRTDEMLDIIVYTAAAILVNEERDEKRP